MKGISLKLAMLAAALISFSAHAAESTLDQDARKVGHATGTAIHEIGHGAKEVGLKIAHGAEKAGKAIGGAAREGGHEFMHAVKSSK